MTRVLSLALLAALVASGCAASHEAAPADGPSLREVFADVFLVGAALNEDQFRGRDARSAPLVPAQFNTITPENVMKWEVLHPEPGVYDFGPADAFVAYGEAHGMAVIGHTLVWHAQTPGWVFEHPDGTPLSRQALLDRMEEHIATVAGRYRGRIHGWDVVNEALNEDGTLRDSPWRRIIGDDYLVHAFRFAHAADPGAELYYNDYTLVKPEKRAGAIRLVRSLQEAGVPVAGVGLQGHWRLDWPDVADLDAAIRDLAPLGDVMITELDIGVLEDPFDGADVQRSAEATDRLDPYRDGLPEAVQQALAQRYAEVFRVLVRHRDVLSRVTFWGVTDGDSWRNGWPVAGRTNYPLLFDRAGAPKPAFDAVIRTLTDTE